MINTSKYKSKGCRDLKLGKSQVKIQQSVADAQFSSWHAFNDNTAIESLDEKEN